jgi:hypothetical protein
MAAFLAVATFLSNEAVKEVVTGTTPGSTTASVLENNRLKIDVAEGNSTLLRVLAAGGPTTSTFSTSWRRSAWRWGIVLASVSIIAARRWLLGAGGAVASAGVVLLLVGLVVV